MPQGDRAGGATSALRRAGGSPAAGGVLLVDDDAALRRSLAAYIEGKLKLRCRVAGDGAQAIEALQLDPPEVALVDIDLPDMSGLDVADLAALLSPRTRVVLMSGYPACIVEANRAEVSVFAVIEKPLPLEVVARFLKRAIAA